VASLVNKVATRNHGGASEYAAGKSGTLVAFRNTAPEKEALWWRFGIWPREWRLNGGLFRLLKT
jgi:hypothetical protein